MFMDNHTDEWKSADEELTDRFQAIWWSREGRMWLSNRQGLRGLLKSHRLWLSAPPAFRTESECRHYCLTAGIHAPIEAGFSLCQRKGPAHHSVSLIQAFGRPSELRPQRLRGSHYSQRRNTPMSQCLSTLQTQSDSGYGGEAGNFSQAHYAGLIAKPFWRASEIQNTGTL